jgi:chromosome segregation ATPase
LEKQKVQDFDYKLEQVDVKVAELRAIQDKCTAGIDALNQRLAAGDSDVQPLIDELDHLKDEIRKAQRKKSEIENELKDIQAECKDKENSVAKTKEGIVNETKKIENASAEIVRARKESLEKLKQRKLAGEEEEIAIVRELESLEQNISAIRDRLRVLENEFSVAKDQVSKGKDAIANLKRQETNRLSAFGPRMGNILKDIDECERAGNWRGAKPIGPFGLYVKLNDQKYRRVVESLLDPLLNSFAVDNDADYQRLQRILRNNETSIPVLKYQRKVDFDFSSGRPSSEFKTVLDILKIEDEVVMQQLIINSNIEKTVLVDTHSEGDRMSRNGLPPNVMGIYTIDCFQIGSRSGGLQTSAMRLYQGLPRLAKDIQSTLQEYQNNLKEKERILFDCGKLLDKCKSDDSELRNDLNQLEVT